MIWTGCIDQATDPPVPLEASLAMAVMFPEGVGQQASFVDTWRVQVSRPGEEDFADRSGAIGAGDQTVEVEIALPLEATCETLLVRVELFSGGQGWFRSEGTHRVCSGASKEILIQQLHWVRPQPTVSPTTIPFTVLQGGVSGGTFSISYDGIDNLEWTAWVLDGDVSWLGLQPAGGVVTRNQPRSVDLAVGSQGLPPGMYTATIRVRGEGFLEPIEDIQVSLTVTQRPRIETTPTSLDFATVEGSNPGTQTFTVTNVGGGTLAWSATDNAGWLSLSPSSGALGSNTSQTVAVNVASQNLAQDAYVAAITVSDPNASNSPSILGVHLNVGQPPSIGLSTTSLTFTSLVGSSPPAQQFTISNAGGGILNWKVSDNVGWLSVSPLSGTLPTGLGEWVTGSVESDGLEPGNYFGTITFVDSHAPNSPRTVPVSLTVKSSLPPMLSNLVATRIQTNDPTCSNSGTRYRFDFEYIDAEGDVLVGGTSFVGEPINLGWHLLPAGPVRFQSLTGEVEGTGFGGAAYFEHCLLFETPSVTSADLFFSLVDGAGKESNTLITNLSRPEGANSPPPTSANTGKNR